MCVFSCKRGSSDFCCQLQVYYSKVKNTNLKIPSRRVPNPTLWIDKVYENAILLARESCPTLHLVQLLTSVRRYHGFGSWVHTYCFCFTFFHFQVCQELWRSVLLTSAVNVMQMDSKNVLYISRSNRGQILKCRKLKIKSYLYC